MGLYGPVRSAAVVDQKDKSYCSLVTVEPGR